MSQQTDDLLKKINETLEKLLSAQKSKTKDSEKKKNTKSGVDFNNANLTKEDVKNLGNYEDIVARIADLEAKRQKSIDIINQGLETQKELSDSYLDNDKEKLKDQFTLLEWLYKQYELKKDISTEERESAKRQINAQKVIVKQTKADIELREKLKNISEQSQKNTEGLITAMTGVKNGSTSIAGTLTKALNTSGGMKEMWEGISTGVKNVLFSVENLTTSLLDKVIESSIMVGLEMDKAFAGFQKSSGAGGEYNDIINTTYQETRILGVSTTEAAQAHNDLRKATMGVYDGNTQIINQLGNLTALMAEVGQNTSITSDAISLMTERMKKTPVEAEKTIRSLVKWGSAIGDVSGVTKDYIATMPQLAAYGSDAEKVFTDLVAASQATNIELQDLLAVTRKMDTFEGAATSAASLNAILGGGLLNSSQLLMASEEERLHLMIKAFEQSGKNFESLNKFEKMQLATVAGFKNVADAQALFGQSLGEYENGVDKVKKLVDAQKEAEEQTKLARDAQEELMILMRQFAVDYIQPIIEAFHWLVQGLSEFLDGNKWVIGSLIALGVAFMAFGTIATFFSVSVVPILNLFGVSLASTGAAAKPAGKAIESLGTSVGKAGASSIKAVPVIFSLAAAILAVGAAIWLASTGLATLVDSAAKAGEIWPTLLLLSVVILAMGAAASVGWKPMLALGAAFLMLGAGVALVGAGIWLAADGVVAIMDAINDFDAENLISMSLGTLAMATSLSILAVSMGAFGIMAPLAIVGFGLFAAGLVMLAASLQLISSRDIENLGVLFGGLGQIVMNANKLSDVPSIIGEVVDKLNEIDDVEGMTQSTIGRWLSKFGSSGFLSALDKIQEKMDSLADSAERFTGAFGGNKLVEISSKISTASGSSEAITKAASQGSDSTLDSRVLNIIKESQTGQQKIEGKQEFVANITIDLGSEKIYKQIRGKFNSEHNNSLAVLEKKNTYLTEV